MSLLILLFPNSPNQQLDKPQCEFWEKELDNKTLTPDLHIYLTFAFEACNLLTPFKVSDCLSAVLVGSLE